MPKPEPETTEPISTGWDTQPGDIVGNIRRLSDSMRRTPVIDARTGINSRIEVYQHVGRMLAKRLENWMQPEHAIERQLGGMAVAMGRKMQLQDLMREVEDTLERLIKVRDKGEQQFPHRATPDVDKYFDELKQIVEAPAALP